MNSALAGELLSPLRRAITLLGRSRRAPILASVAALVFAAGAVAVVAAVAAVLLLSLWLSLCLELLIFLVCIQRKTTLFCACFHQESLLRDLRLFGFGMIQYVSSCLLATRKNTIFQVKIAISCGLMPFAPQEKMQSLFERLRFSLGS